VHTYSYLYLVLSHVHVIIVMVHMMDNTTNCGLVTGIKDNISLWKRVSLVKIRGLTRTSNFKIRTALVTINIH